MIFEIFIFLQSHFLVTCESCFEKNVDYWDWREMSVTVMTPMVELSIGTRGHDNATSRNNGGGFYAFVSSGSSGLHGSRLRVHIIGVKIAEMICQYIYIEGGFQNIYPTTPTSTHIYTPPYTSSFPHNHPTIRDEIDTCTILHDRVHRHILPHIT